MVCCARAAAAPEPLRGAGAVRAGIADKTGAGPEEPKAKHNDFSDMSGGTAEGGKAGRRAGRAGDQRTRGGHLAINREVTRWL